MRTKTFLKQILIFVLGNITVFLHTESKAQPAEDLYRKSIIDSTQIAYALVHVKNGEAVIKDVMINGKSIADLINVSENK